MGTAFVDNTHDQAVGGHSGVGLVAAAEGK